MQIKNWIIIAGLTMMAPFVVACDDSTTTVVPADNDAPDTTIVVPEDKPDTTIVVPPADTPDTTIVVPPAESSPDSDSPAE